MSLFSIRPAVSYPSGHRASLPLTRYQIILLGDRGSENDLSRVDAQKFVSRATNMQAVDHKYAALGN